MLCSKPYRQGVLEYGCGQCMPCRINKRRLWVSRLMLECHVQPHAQFVTLTYDKAHVPLDGSLQPRDLTLFLKRLRKAVFPDVLRYFAVGEYGDISRRPHYHLVLFGVREPGSRVGTDGVIRRAWSVDGVPIGYVYIGDVTPESCNYVVGYVCKGMTRSGDARLDGRAPEFARMSLGCKKHGTGGIGSGAVPAIVEHMVKKYGVESIASTGDVPTFVRTAQGVSPLGRYLRRKVREGCGFEEVCEPKRVSEARARSLQVEIAGPVGRSLREGKRVQSERNAVARVSINRSKKGVGL